MKKKNKNLLYIIGVAMVSFAGVLRMLDLKPGGNFEMTTLIAIIAIIGLVLALWGFIKSNKTK